MIVAEIKAQFNIFFLPATAKQEKNITNIIGVIRVPQDSEGEKRETSLIIKLYFQDTTNSIASAYMDKIQYNIKQLRSYYIIFSHNMREVFYPSINIVEWQNNTIRYVLLFQAAGCWQGGTQLGQ